MLATKAGITLSQTNNWFGNKRIRYKKKCVELAKKRQRDEVPLTNTVLSSEDHLSAGDDSLFSTPDPNCIQQESESPPDPKRHKTEL